MDPSTARRPNGAVPEGGAVAKGAPRGRSGVRSRAALMPLLARLETVGLLRSGPCEAYYGTRGNVPCGRYRPRYGPGWWW